METVTFYLFWLYRRRGRIGNDIETADEVTQTLTAKENGFDLPADRQDALLSDPVETKLKYALEFSIPGFTRLSKVPSTCRKSIAVQRP